MLSCREATRLLSDRLERPLSRRERLSLWLHIAMCNACRNFGRQAQFLRRAAGRFADADPWARPEQRRKRR